MASGRKALRRGKVSLGILFTLPVILFAVCTAAADTIEGQVLGGGAPIAKSSVTLWSATADAPKQLGQSQTGDDGRFTLSVEGSPTGVLCLVAKGGEPRAHRGSQDNPAIALLSVIGSAPLQHVTINEFTTIASVWTNAQFLNGINATREHVGQSWISRRDAPFQWFVTAAQGLDPNQLSAVAFGKYHPIASNDTAEGRAQNRRINIVIQDQTP